MSTIYPNMGLKSWNSASDIFSYTELDANWDAINAHDHTGPGKGLQIPAGGLANNAVTAAAIAAGEIDNSKINASAGIVDTKLASPNNGIWRTVIERVGVLKNTGSDPQFLGIRGDGSANETTDISYAGRAFYFDPADYVVAGKTTKIRLRGWVVSGAVSPNTALTLRISTVVSTTALSAAIGVTTLASPTLSDPGANGMVQGVGTDMTAPAAGWYALTCSCSVAASATAVVTSQLQLSHV